MRNDETRGWMRWNENVVWIFTLQLRDSTSVCRKRLATGERQNFREGRKIPPRFECHVSLLEAPAIESYLQSTKFHFDCVVCRYKYFSI